MATYNQSNSLAVAIDSILNQTIKDIEFIIVNDGSTDNTAQILSEHANKDPRVKIITQKNQGLAIARNNGVAKSKSKYIAFMDSDDASAINRLEVHLDFLEKNTNFSACRVGGDGLIENYRRGISGIYTNKYTIFLGSPYKTKQPFSSLGSICCMTRESFNAIGGCRHHPTIIEDIDFTLRYSSLHTWAALATQNLYFRNVPYTNESKGLTNSNVKLFAKRHAVSYISEWCRYKGLSDPVEQNKDLENVLNMMSNIPWRDREVIYRNMRYLRHQLSVIEGMSNRQTKNYLMGFMGSNLLERWLLSMLFRILD